MENPCDVEMDPKNTISTSCWRTKFLRPSSDLIGWDPISTNDGWMGGTYLLLDPINYLLRWSATSIFNVFLVGKELQRRVTTNLESLAYGMTFSAINFSELYRWGSHWSSCLCIMRCKVVTVYISMITNVRTRGHKNLPLWIHISWSLDQNSNHPTPGHQVLRVEPKKDIQ